MWAVLCYPFEVLNYELKQQINEITTKHKLSVKQFRQRLKKLLLKRFKINSKMFVKLKEKIKSIQIHK